MVVDDRVPVKITEVNFTLVHAQKVDSTNPVQSPASSVHLVMKTPYVLNMEYHLNQILGKIFISLKKNIFVSA